MSYDTNDFETDVIKHSHEIPVVVDFWAEWCGPCRVLGPVLEKLAEQQKDKWSLAKLNTEIHPQIAAEYGIRGIPAVKLFVDGNVADEFTGALPEQMVLQWLDKALPSEHRKQLEEAERLIAEGKMDGAQGLLQEVLETEPDNHQAKVWLARTYLYSDYDKALDLVADIQEDSDYFDLTDGIRAFVRLFQLTDQLETLPENSVREQYISGIENLRSENFDAALEKFVEVIRTDRNYDEDGARKACIAIFKYLGEEDEITQKHRKAFSSALYV